MESSGRARRLIGKLLLVLLLGATGWAFYVQASRPIVRDLANRADNTIYLAVLTQPAMLVSYNPQSRKAILTNISLRQSSKDPAVNAKDLFKAANVSPVAQRYYVPLTEKRDEYWQQFKFNLTNWRKQPYINIGILYDYLQALHDKRTNLKPSEFLLLAMDGTRLELTDFTVKNIAEDKKKKGKSKSSDAAPDSILPPVEDRAPLAMEDRPLVLEILNASGVKGAAQELTQFLREQSQKGLLNVDVLQYDNYPGEKQKQTRIIDFTGRRTYLKQVSTAIGVNNEIVSEKQDTAICDARIIIGEDFRQPM
ncbi:MAG: LytR C-terminal domain-containing protein [Elusimicrobiaceae bacterium]|nr:LytR C-terminal domain-containing protein [Elusimicrobiaceae bacterium]